MWVCYSDVFQIYYAWSLMVWMLEVFWMKECIAFSYQRLILRINTVLDVSGCSECPLDR